MTVHVITMLFGPSVMAVCVCEHACVCVHVCVCVCVCVCVLCHPSMRELFPFVIEPVSYLLLVLHILMATVVST